MKDVSSRGLRTIYATLIVLIVCSLIFSVTIKANGLFYYLVMPVMACFFFGKFVMAMMFCQGWKAFSRKMISGLPIGLFVFYTIILALLFGMVFVNQGMSFPATQKNINVFIFNAFIGVFGSLIAWFAGIKDWMAGGSEYDAIKHFKHKGYSDKKTKEEIYKLKNLGLIHSNLAKDN